LNFVHEGGEGGIEVAELAHANGLEDAGMGIGGARAEQQAWRNVELGIQVVVFVVDLHRTLPSCIGMMGMIRRRGRMVNCELRIRNYEGAYPEAIFHNSSLLIHNFS
jgi:hypothetical protein